MIGARILADSISPAGARITTMEWTYQRFIHSEVMTYRVSRNAASSRAIPVMVTIRRVLKDPAGPVWWGQNQKGMQARAELPGWRRWLAHQLWYKARFLAVAIVVLMVWLGLHKQISNRLLEPWTWITTIVTACPEQWENIWRQRCHPDAQPEFRVLAEAARCAYLASTPVERIIHAPLVETVDWVQLHAVALDASTAESGALKISTARCARISYLTHDGQRSIYADLDLYGRLSKADPPHTSPFEHACVASDDPERWSGSAKGWVQHRETVDPYFIHREHAA